MRFIRLDFSISPKDPFTEIMIHELSECGADTFLENPIGFETYFSEDEWDENKILYLVEKYDEHCSISYSKEWVEEKNWNEEWEKNFSPVILSDKVYIRAPFHPPDKSFPYTIIIQPKMSFGTGHHETTALMIDLMLQLDFNEKSVLDMGSGTGILAIMASKLGANDIVAIDNHEWAYENCKENAKLNGAEIEIILGDASAIPQKLFDAVLANINKNVLLQDFQSYARVVKNGGYILMSGFYDFDQKDLELHAKKFNFELIESKQKNSWSAVVFQKS